MNFDEWDLWRSRVRNRLESLGANPLTTDRPGAWTQAQVVHHILKTNRTVAGLLANLAEKAGPRPVGQPEPVSWPVREDLVGFPASRAFSIDAAPGTEPDQAPDALTLGTLGSEVEKALRGCHQASADRAVEGAVFPHRLAGPLNYYEWLVFLVVHEELHVARLEADMAGE